MNQKFNLFLFISINLLIVINASTPGILSQYCVFETEDDQAQQFYDLRSLSLKSGYFTVKNGTDTYLINICSNTNSFKSPLNNATVCSKRTAVCLIKESEPSLEFELAHFNSGQLSLDKDKNLTIGYSEANSKHLFHSNCPTLNTTITFVCNKTRALENAPTFKGISNCTIKFDWQTSESCADSHTVLEPHFKNGSLIFLIGENKTVNLDDVFEAQIVHAEYAGASKSDKYDFVISKDVKRFLQNSTSKNMYTFNLTTCEDAFVCQLKADRSFVRSVAKITNPALKHANDTFHLFLPSDSKCGRTNSQTNVATIFNLNCDGGAKNITFKAENNLCHYIFDLYHPKVCDYEKLFDDIDSTVRTNQKPVDDRPKDAVKPIEQKNATAKPTDKPKETTKIETTVAPLAKLDNLDNQSSLSSLSRTQPSTQSGDSSNSNTTLFGFIILVIVSVVGIVLAVFSLINDDRRFVTASVTRHRSIFLISNHFYFTYRAWLQNRVRRVIQPQTATSFHYSQVHNDSSRLVPLDSVHDDFH